MAKVSPVSIKYMVHAKFEAEGMVEKPDVIGALFGQTEGLLGNELEMRELQKEGKIGRIEVKLESKESKTLGDIEVPSALDKAETTLIAAAIETIEKIGPSNAKITIERIEDVRENKREYILERAKKLLEAIDEKMPKTKEMSANLKTQSREAKLQEVGEEKLPAGDLSGNEVIVVEGRADVVNLLRNNVNNVIGMNGTNLPRSLKEIIKDKEVTLFTDGDRGGVLIARNVIDNARVDFVATAPEGKEVEELTDKEILISLRRKIPVGEFINNLRFKRPPMRSREYGREDFRRDDREEAPLAKRDFSDSERKKLTEMLNDIENSKKIMLLNSNLEEIGSASERTLFSGISRANGKVAVMVTDTATLSVIKAAERERVPSIVARNFKFTGETRVDLISL